MKRLVVSCRDRYDFFPALIFAHLFFYAAPVLFSLPRLCFGSLEFSISAMS
jgi:hypothetical protein